MLPPGFLLMVLAERHFRSKYDVRLQVLEALGKGLQPLVVNAEREKLDGNRT